MSFSEKDLDQILNKNLRESGRFADWFISKTRFSNLNAKYEWSRVDHPWGRFTFEIVNQFTNEIETITRDSETDILVVFEIANSERVALHIENKLADGKYTDYQPELYSQRANEWLNNKEYGNYSDFETVLVSPISFYTNNFEQSQFFDKFISYEEIAILIPEFKEYLQNLT